ncbi:zinc finger protein CONSTANS-like [Chenopodium quinoa]|uniref:zinc finger protein CONSTANS-like n=1 Tax=Chenopodium quinoa TaxID=63459 RepID=UPI000B771158|nr:zinc finger protein CONSTANS-like [Chenopodium quinoa]
MASTLPSNTFFTPQNQVTQSNVNYPMHYGLTMWLGQDQDDCFFPFSNNFGCFDDLILSENTNNNVSIDSSCNSSSTLMEVPCFGTSAFDYYNNHGNGHTNSSGSTYDELESNGYGALHSYVPSANNYVATPPECWEFQGHTTSQVTGSENSSNKVGKYSVEEKKERILRYLKKRNQRNFRKTIKYACRKTLADRRVRIRGRFAKNQEEESPSSYDHYRNIVQDKASNKIYQCGDFNGEWVQEAMSSLLYVPSISSWHPNGTTSFLSDYK